MLRKTSIALAALTLAACSKKKENALTIPVEPVTRQTIVVSAEATGVVEPINVIEVKSKSSGQIVAMPVEIGTFVKAGDLLVQLDTRDTRNAYAQAKADVDAALIKLRVSKTARAGGHPPELGDDSAPFPLVERLGKVSIVAIVVDVD